MSKNIYSLILALMFLYGALSAQEKKSTLLFNAMQEELDRSMKGLSLPNMARPFFIEYTVTEGKQLTLSATLGSIKTISETPLARGVYANVLVGDYHRTNTRRFDTQITTYPSAVSYNTTTDGNFSQLKRDLWRRTDIVYKRAVEDYSKKMALLNQKTVTKDEIDLDDFTKIDKVEKMYPSNNIVIDKARISSLLEKLSAEFKKYTDIDDSEISATISSNNVYVVNSEGSKYSFPNNLVNINVIAQGNVDGKVVTDNMYISALQESDLPSFEELKLKLNEFAEKFVRMINATSIKDYYSGPVLFEGGAVAELFENELFSKTGIYASRKSMDGEGPTTLAEKIGCKVISNEFTVKCLPFLKEYDGTKLVGHFEMDLEGVVPEKELTLIENGVLKNVIGTRIQTKYNKVPSGYFRSGSHPSLFQKELTPGNVDISSSKGVSKELLKQLLLKTARESGYKYAYIVRKFGTSQIGWSSLSYYPVYLYKVNVDDGSEEPVKDAEFRDYRPGLLKQVLGTSNKKIVINNCSGMVPVSYICPDAVLLPDLEIAWKKDMQKTPKPVVKNPLKD